MNAEEGRINGLIRGSQGRMRQKSGDSSFVGCGPFCRLIRIAGDDNELFRLHRKILAGSALAAERIAELLLPILNERTARRFPGLDEHLVSDAVTDALLNYLSRPQRFDPGRNVFLRSFIARKAEWRIQDGLLAESRRRLREKA